MLDRARIWMADYAYAARVNVGATLRHRRVPRARGDLAPVLLIPGVYERWQFMRAVGGRLAKRGHAVHVVEPLGRNLAAVPEAAAMAQAYLDDNDLRDVVVVAHSKGGLIAKHMMSFDDLGGRIRGLVAIATPFSGSSLARYAPTRPLRDFDPAHATLTLLAEQAEVNSHIVSIFPEFDPHIPGGSHLEGAHNIQLPVDGHFRLLADPHVLDAVVEAVESGFPRRPE
jgi:pimeloyl-ACP methyl ester carboxylesterase